MAQRESAYARFPDYRVDLKPSRERLRIRFEGQLIAESASTLLVNETKHAPVVYFPREDIHFEHLERTAHSTFCPFKGEASYWTLRANGRVEENAVWSYEAPFAEVAELKDYLSFYPDRTELEGDS